MSPTGSPLCVDGQWFRGVCSWEMTEEFLCVPPVYTGPCVLPPCLSFCPCPGQLWDLPTLRWLSPHGYRWASDPVLHYHQMAPSEPLRHMGRACPSYLLGGGGLTGPLQLVEESLFLFFSAKDMTQICISYLANRITQELYY